MPSFNKTKKHFDDRRTAPFIPGAPVLAAGTLVCSGSWEETRATPRPEGESIRLLHPIRTTVDFFNFLRYFCVYTSSARYTRGHFAMHFG